MILYPVWEVDHRLVTPGDGKFGLLLGFIRSRRGDISRNENTSPPETICNAANLEINVVHLAKLLRCLLIIAS